MYYFDYLDGFEGYIHHQLILCLHKYMSPSRFVLVCLASISLLPKPRNNLLKNSGPGNKLYNVGNPGNISRRDIQIISRQKGIMSYRQCLLPWYIHLSIINFPYFEKQIFSAN